ncbi:MAG: MBL fold metallo-hydrolase [Chloroflexi bacterium]|nr:MAG: MBL fold metallo-hydrolase [Chloroflexota bacterium]
MPLEIVTFVLGPVQTNAYLIADVTSGEAAVIDPAWDGNIILAEAQKRGWRIAHLWHTHAHFDHIGGSAEIFKALTPPPQVALHPSDRLLWSARGGAPLFGLNIPAAPKPTLALEHGQTLKLGNLTLQVRHTPGHTPGHVVFYCANAPTALSTGVCFCGDLIFAGSVGRTDLPGGNWDTLVASIRLQIFTLPDETRLLPGHGPETTVGKEKLSNPFVGLATDSL